MGSVTVVEAISTKTASIGMVWRSPFEGHAPFERPSRAGQIGVCLSAGSLRSVTLVGTWPSAAPALCEALGTALGCAVPAGTGDTLQLADMLLLRTGPEEFHLVSERSVDLTRRLREKIGADVGSVTDLSHARCRITVEGDKCLDALSKLFALDLRESAFPVGQARLTGHHHVACTLHRLARERFDIYVFSTYAFDQLATVIDAALEYGVALRPAEGDRGRL